MRKHLLTAAAAAMAMMASTAPFADAQQDRGAHQAATHAIALLSTERAASVIRARHIRFIGDPYLYNGRYVVRCYDERGLLAYCAVDPYSGAFLGLHVTL
jgi:hypothetical protein